MNLAFRFLEKPVLEKQDGNHTCGNGCIRNIEDWPEEFERLATPERKPIRVMRIGDDGEIKHVNDLPVQQAGISAGESLLKEGSGYKLGEWIASFKQTTVKNTVDQVADGSSIYQCGTKQKSQGIAFSGDLAQIPGARNDRHQPEQCQRNLAPVAPKFPAISHAFIFDEVKPKPGNAVNDRVFLPYEIMCLDVDLEGLIRKEDQEADDEDMPQFQGGWY